MRPKILIACEYSGTVRDAFIKRGFDATSCDILPSESPGPHYQGDVLDIINSGFDLMIGHPPCTYISYAATHCWNDPGRVFKRLDALNFFAKLWEAPIKMICLENPKSCASPVIAKYSQSVQPYYFGDASIKTTWLWLKNLPKLQYKLEPDLFGETSAASKPKPVYVDKSGKNRHFADAINGQRKGSHFRSKFWPGIADAMAEQWGAILNIEAGLQPATHKGNHS